MSNQYYEIHYEFGFPSGIQKTFKLVLDKWTMSLVNFHSRIKPEWTELLHRQCNCCTLSAKTHRYCPVAVNIAELVESFKDFLSTEECRVRCITPERIYLKDTQIQEGLYSILGVVMATSGCPVMNFYKPMARFHLPFSTAEETIFRSASIYLLRQYFEHKRGRRTDLEMQELGRHLQSVQDVNSGIIDRIRSVINQDADANAVIILDSFSRLLEMAIEDRMADLEYLFPFTS